MLVKDFQQLLKPKPSSITSILFLKTKTIVVYSCGIGMSIYVILPGMSDVYPLLVPADALKEFTAKLKDADVDPDSELKIKPSTMTEKVTLRVGKIKQTITYCAEDITEIKSAAKFKSFGGYSMGYADFIQSVKAVEPCIVRHSPNPLNHLLIRGIYKRMLPSEFKGLNFVGCDARRISVTSIDQYTPLGSFGQRPEHKEFPAVLVHCDALSLFSRFNQETAEHIDVTQDKSGRVKLKRGDVSIISPESTGTYPSYTKLWKGGTPTVKVKISPVSSKEIKTYQAMLVSRVEKDDGKRLVVYELTKQGVKCTCRAVDMLSSQSEIVELPMPFKATLDKVRRPMMLRVDSILFDSLIKGRELDMEIRYETVMGKEQKRRLPFRDYNGQRLLETNCIVLFSGDNFYAALMPVIIR